ncbi:transposase [Neisseria meningitidis]|nr:transposase [Neisseria meningitidis]
MFEKYSGLTKNQDKAAKPQTVQIVRQGGATPYRFLLIHYKLPSENLKHKDEI